MAYCQSIIALVARLGLIDGSGPRGPSQRDRPWHLRLAAHGCRMEHPALRGRSILVIEDEPLIGMDIRQALEKAGATVTQTTTVRHALILVEHDGLSGAIMDHALADGDSTQLCVRLKERGIPYVSYSGFDAVKGADPAAPWIGKPASMDTLLSALAELLAGRPPRVS
jgi:CheY-like chemotaxis protein